MVKARLKATQPRLEKIVPEGEALQGIFSCFTIHLIAKPEMLPWGRTDTNYHELDYNQWEFV